MRRGRLGDANRKELFRFIVESMSVFFRHGVMTTEALFLTALQLFDGWTTYQIIERFGGKETNPVMNWLIEKVGTLAGAVVIAKVIAIVLVWVLAICGVDLALAALTGVYLWVAYNNYTVYRKLRHGSAS